MEKVILKTGKRRTSIPRALITQAVIEVCEMDLSAPPEETAAKVKSVARPRRRNKHSLKDGKASKLR